MKYGPGDSHRYNWLFANNLDVDVQFVTFRADGLPLKQDGPVIPPGVSRNVDTRQAFDLDWFIVLAFMKDAVIPPRLEVTQAVEGSGGGASVGLTIGGTGGSIGAQGSKTETVYFSSGVAALTVGQADEPDPSFMKGWWVLNQDVANKSLYWERKSADEFRAAFPGVPELGW